MATVDPAGVGVKESTRERLGSRTTSKRGEYRAAQARKHRAVTPDTQKPDLMSLPERLRVIKNNLGFLPVSKLEATQALRLMNDLGKRTSTVVFLNEILKHQLKDGVETDNPERAPNHVVLDFANHRDDARMSTTLLALVHSRLTDILNPKLSLEVVLDEIPIEMYAPVLRHVQLGALVVGNSTPKTDAVDQVLNFDFISTPVEGDFLISLHEYSEFNTVKTARDHTLDAMGQQALRAGFWNERVIEAGGHIVTAQSSRRLSL